MSPATEATSDKSPAPPERKSIFDSPWYWAYVFCAAALAALFIMQPKFARRQTIDEQNFQGRQRANQQALGQEPSTPLSSEEDRIVTLTPLYLLLGTVFFVTWAGVWWTTSGRRWWRRRREQHKVPS